MSEHSFTSVCDGARCTLSDNSSAADEHSLTADSRYVAAAASIGRVSYKNISMLFLFPVKDGKLSTGVNATFDASCNG